MYTIASKVSTLHIAHHSKNMVTLHLQLQNTIFYFGYWYYWNETKIINDYDCFTGYIVRATHHTHKAPYKFCWVRFQGGDIVWDWIGDNIGFSLWPVCKRWNDSQMVTMSHSDDRVLNGEYKIIATHSFLINIVSSTFKCLTT